MLYYDRTDASERIDLSKTRVSIFVIIGIFEIKDLSFNKMYAMDTMNY